jgi:polysaccharide deacetylase family protein (PEP-CTERM system associated)
MTAQANKNMNILTFDIEEWFHILDNESTKSEKEWANFDYRLDANMDRIFNLLEKHQQKATFFCLGWVAREFPHIIKKIHENGYEIATHSDRHQLAYDQTQEEFRTDLHTSMSAIEDTTGVKVTSYRAPGFSLKSDNSWVFDELIDSGITIDCSIFPARRTHGGFERFGHAEPAIVKRGDATIKEFPINLYEFMGRNLIFSGGGYFRLLPYPLIKMMMKHSDYVMTYFHPRDFDAGQPMIKELSAVRRFKSYYGLGGAFKKLEKLITDFDFVDIREADASIDWSDAKQIVI